MAISNHIALVLCVVLVLLPTTITATEFVVGDDYGWTIGFDYQAWAKDKVFRVGDTLVFNYPKGVHDVFKVNSSSFENCIIPPPSEALNSGHDVVPLVESGKKWYLCGVGQHCSKFNQKLAINVMSA